MSKILAAEIISHGKIHGSINDFPSNNKALIIVRKQEYIAYFNFLRSALNVVLFNTVLSYK